MANSKIKQILVGSTTYDIEDAGAAHLSANNTFTGVNTFAYNSIKINNKYSDHGASWVTTIQGWDPTGGGNNDFILTLPKTSGTITVGVKANGTIHAADSSGLVDLGTIGGSSSGVTSVTTSGSGNAVTSASISGHTLTLTKGSTFLTAHQSLASCAKLSGGNTFSGVQKFNNKVNIISNDGLYVSGPTQVNTLSITMGKILYPASETNVHEYKLPDTGGTLALTSDIDVTAAGNNTFTGTNTFKTTEAGNALYRTLIDKNGVSVGAGPGGIAEDVTYGFTNIKRLKVDTKYIYSFPNKSGTFALTSDIPDMSNYVDLNSSQTITGEKQFRNAIFVAQPKSYNGYIAGNPTASSTTIYDNWHIDFKNKDNSHKGSISIPSVNGDLHTFALLEDIKIKSASLSGTTLTLTI